MIGREPLETSPGHAGAATLVAPRPLEVIVIGAGSRATLYASFAKKAPDRLRIVGVVDPDAAARERVRQAYGIPAHHSFSSIDAYLAAPRLGQAVINGTMDRDHVPTTLPLLEAGLDVLLEKPICTELAELVTLSAAAARLDRRVMICHVLRYAPFYQRLHALIREGAIGAVRTIHTSERVSYHHMATAFVRGKWNRRESSCPMLLAKCCHDLDLLTWLAAPQRPTRVASFGGRTLFREDLAPDGAGTRCLTDCAIERQCPYSARRLYVDGRLWQKYAWGQGAMDTLSDAEKLALLAGDHRYGRCVWRCDNDVVDQQKVLVSFDGGIIATHEMIGGLAEGGRTIHVCGTLGELEGCLEKGRLELRRPSLDEPGATISQTFDFREVGEMHGGGDMRLVDDFVRVMGGAPPSPSTTELADSIQGHLVAFAADRAMLTGQVVDLDEMWRRTLAATPPFQDR